jgi:hypothetical protein
VRQIFFLGIIVLNFIWLAPLWQFVGQSFSQWCYLWSCTSQNASCSRGIPHSWRQGEFQEGRCWVFVDTFYIDQHSIPFPSLDAWCLRRWQDLDNCKVYLQFVNSWY